MTSRSIGTAMVTLLLLPAAPASAQQAKCLAGKTGCMAKKAAGLLKCEALAETPGKPADRNAKDCVTKVQTKFGDVAPAKGCFGKLESKVLNDCPTVDDTGAAETAVDACVAAIVAAIDPPPLDQTKCGAGEKKCASKYLGALLKCRTLAQTPGKPTDPNTKGCVDKAVAKYTDGAALATPLPGAQEFHERVLVGGRQPLVGRACVERLDLVRLDGFGHRTRPAVV